jgi:ureidoacrylate peracid hydrolase
MKMPALIPAIEPVMLEAAPQSLQIDLQRSAVVVIDMQNAFTSKGGMLDLMGLDISENLKAVEVIKKIITASRTRGVSVIYVVHYYSPDLRETGGPNSGYWYNVHVRGIREHPEWGDKAIILGTWGAEIVKELKPQEDEIIVVKPKYNAFFGTDLDTILKTFNIKYLVFVGVATNICVEGAIRDACNLDYFPILVSDGTAAAGPPSAHEATINNVKLCFGWVTTSENIIKALQRA